MAKNLIQAAFDWWHDKNKTEDLSTSSIDATVQDIETQEEEYNRLLFELGHEKKRRNNRRMDSSEVQAEIDKLRKEKEQLIKDKKFLERVRPQVAEKENRQELGRYYDQLQAERDRLAQTQNNSVGRGRNRQRDINSGDRVRPRDSYDDVYDAKHHGAWDE